MFYSIKLFYNDSNEKTSFLNNIIDDNQNLNLYNNYNLSDEQQTTEKSIQHLCFRLHTDEFLLSMEAVREIIMLPNITFVPRSDPIIEGIIALRGEIIPVLNLRRLLEFEKGVSSSTTRVIILHSENNNFGLIVDEITEVFSLPMSGIETLEQNFFGSRYLFLSGVAKFKNKMRGIVDVNKIVSKFFNNDE